MSKRVCVSRRWRLTSFFNCTTISLHVWQYLKSLQQRPDSRHLRNAPSHSLPWRHGLITVSQQVQIVYLTEVFGVPNLLQYVQKTSLYNT